MANTVTFSCTSLKNLGKKGFLGTNERGNYEMVVGGLNVFNSAGEYYVLDQARELFESSSSFMRRVNQGTLRGELGHPKFSPGMNSKDYIRRLMSIYEENTSCIHKSITLDFERVKDRDGKPIVAIVSEVSPSGPHGEQLRKSLESDGENVCFSIRAFTDDYMENRITKRILRTIITFDQVNEPGIEFAEKFKSPSCESELFTFSKEFVRAPVSRATLESLQEQSNVAGIAMESSINMTATELFRNMGWSVRKDDVPAFLKWGRED